MAAAADYAAAGSQPAGDARPKRRHESNTTTSTDADGGGGGGGGGGGASTADLTPEGERIAVACLPCSKSKVRCSYGIPCERCIKRGTRKSHFRILLFISSQLLLIDRYAVMPLNRERVFASRAPTAGPTTEARTKNTPPVTR